MLALSALTGWLLFAGLIIATGAIAGRWAMLPRLVGTEALHDTAALRDSTSRLGLVGAAILPLAMVLFFVRQVAEFRDPFVPWLEDAELLLTGTAWGRAWALGLTGSVITVIGFGMANLDVRPGWPVATLGVLGLSTFPAFTGHASGGEGPTVVMIVSDALHVLAAGSWIGGLVLVLFLDLRSRSEGGPQAGLLPVLVPAFSPLAVTCVAVLVTTGGLASLVHLDSLSALWTTTYGRLLGTKLFLVAIVMALGANNWRRLTPRLNEPGGQDGMRRAAAIETLLAQAVLLVTAILVRTPPM